MTDTTTDIPRGKPGPKPKQDLGLRRDAPDDDYDEPSAQQIAANLDANARAAVRWSVKDNAVHEQKYILTIAESEDVNAVNPVPILNGDYSIFVRRGRPVIVPECAITVLKDAKGASYNDTTKQWRAFTSYPAQWEQYDGELPIHTEVDERGQKVTHATH